MLKSLQERVNRGTKEAHAKGDEEKSDGEAEGESKPEPVHDELSRKLADRQLQIEELVRKIIERLSAAGGSSEPDREEQ